MLDVSQALRPQYAFTTEYACRVSIGHMIERSARLAVSCVWGAAGNVGPNEFNT